MGTELRKKQGHRQEETEGVRFSGGFKGTGGRHL
jgi:hypothetical protein